MRVFRRRHRTADLERRIAREIESLRPMLKINACALRLERFDAESRIVYLEITGDCPDCDMTAATLVRGIEAHLRRRVPEIESVRAATRPG